MTKSLTLAFSLLALTACSSSSSPASTGDSGAADSGPASDAANTPVDSSAPVADSATSDSGPGVDSAAEVAHCGQPGDTGNSLGVGKFCATSADCKGAQASLCSSLGGPATSFCTFICTLSDAGNPCGDGATCGCQASSGTCACTPNYCL